MGLRRTILAFLMSLTMALAPFASAAIAKPCAMTTDIAVGASAKCPCHGSMLDCGSMPQCSTAAGCVSQCFAWFGIVPAVSGHLMPDQHRLETTVSRLPSSLSVEPPSPPPRA